MFSGVWTTLWDNELSSLEAGSDLGGGHGKTVVVGQSNVEQP